MTDDISGTPRVPFHRNPNYLLLVTAQGLSLTGREIESLVMPLLVLGLTGSPGAMTAGMLVTAFAAALSPLWRAGRDRDVA